MRVLITGAGGFIGRHAAAAFYQARHDVFLSKGRTEGGIDLRLAPPSVGPVDVVVHLAADSSVAESREMPRRCIENNVGALLTMLDYARAHDSRFVLLSTDEAEDPTNPYGASKAAQEAIVDAYRASYHLATTVVRADLVVGAGQPAHKFVPAAAHALLEREPVEVFTRYGVVGRRRWQGVRNLADALVFAAQAWPASPVCHVGGASLGNDEVATYVAEILGVTPKMRQVERRDVRATSASTFVPVLSQFGWEPPYSLRQELELMLSTMVRS